MDFSSKAADEVRRLSLAESFRDDMDIVAKQRHNPFVKEGRVDTDAYIEFVTQFNEFINHEPKPFQRIIDRDMRL
ncbi:MAG: hypothetical protein K8I29_07630 [Alphaproteobacteria bacterium]|uniref:Uncharacterized protein n=1 Tax=Candidatus Nitrobium versatile TaxID=2884831 RepID=A0A953J7J7_9BACT|nr:hypothetical protein [Candidatus Nitrobium versatile]